MALAFTAAQARASDDFNSKALGIPSLILMENAALGIAHVVRDALKSQGQDLGGRSIGIACGAGQNGGDGFVVARHLSLMGAHVHVYLVFAPEKIQGDAKTNLQILQKMSTVPVHNFSQVEDQQEWQRVLRPHCVLIDAIFGTGLRSDVVGVPAAAIAAINVASALRVAVDVPSGIDVDTGKVRGVGVRADVTATMAAHKVGLLVDAQTPVGRIHVVGLGAPVHTPPEGGPYAHWIDAQLVQRWLPRQLETAHKGSRGHLLLIAGSPGKTGAAALAGRSAMRAGAGLVTVATTRQAQVALDTKLWEVMSAAYAEGDDAEPTSRGQLDALAMRCKAIALGPGIPTGPQMQSLVHSLVVDHALPMVVDADGLNHLGAQVTKLSAAAGPRVLTPHPVEMGRLLGIAVDEVQADRLGCARKLAAVAGSVVVLKGARTLVAQPDGTVFINPAASASLATAGSGDVLTGVIGAFLAQGLGAIEAAVCGVFVHARAAQQACERLALTNLVAGDLADAVAQELRIL